MIEITTSAEAPFATGIWKVNDFGTNNTVAALIAATVMVVGALAWCFSYRWGAGLAGGGGRGARWMGRAAARTRGMADQHGRGGCRRGPR